MINLQTINLRIGFAGRMPKATGKGGKTRKRGKNDNEDYKRELEFKEDGQEYGRVNKMLGNGRVECYCFDGKTRLCNIRGKMRKKVWIGVGDIVLIGLRDFQDDKADIIMKYTPDEAQQLKAYGEIPENETIDNNETNERGDEDACVFQFEIDSIYFCLLKMV